MTTIYQITNPLNEKYIGSTNSKMRQRKAEHKYTSKKNRQGKVYDSFRKFGFENHEFKELCKVKAKDRYELEHFIIQEFDPKLNMVKEHNKTATGKIWVNNGVKEFQILPKFFNSYSDIKKGRIKFKT